MPYSDKEKQKFRNKEYYNINKEEMAIKKKEYYEKNKEEILKRNNKYKEKNKEKIREMRKKYREKNKNKVDENKKGYMKEYGKKYYEENKERLKPLRDEYKEKNKEKLKEKQKKWYEEHKEEIALKVKIRRNKDGERKSYFKRKYNLTMEEREGMFFKQEGKCLGCGELLDLESKNCTVDHDHNNGEVRGILCNYCNTCLGYSKDKYKTLINLANYIKPWEEKRKLAEEEKETLKQLGII